MYEVTITRDYKVKEKYIATEFKTIKSNRSWRLKSLAFFYFV